MTLHFRKLSLLILLLLIAVRPVVAQANIDSIQKLVNVKTGKVKFKYLLKLSETNRAAGRYDIALIFAKQLLELSISDTSLHDEQSACFELGAIYQNKFEFDKSLKYYLKASELYEQENILAGLATVKNNIGEVYRHMRNYSNAIEYMNAALEINKKLENPAGIAFSENGLGAVYYDMNELEKAVVYFKSALIYYKLNREFTNVALSQNNIGSIYNELEKYPEAIANYQAAMAVFTQLNDSVNYAMCLANVGNVYNIMGDYKKGIECSLYALAISTRLNDRFNIAACYVFLAEGYQFSGDYKHAFEYQTKLLNLKDTIYDLETNQNIAEMQTRFDTEKKEKENQILKQENDLQILSINRQKIINYSVSLGLLLVLGLAFFIYKGYKQKQKANLQLEEKNLLIEEKNKIVEEKNKDITDSIRYAKRLQTAILKPENTLSSYFDDGFILFKPKDIVSGDFYWFEKFGNLSLIAAADCTGHGVPGAFMSIIGCNLLSQAVNEYAITQPAAILNSINKGLTKVLQQKGDADSFVTDGMDIALCSFDTEKMLVEYSGAFNPMWLIRNDEVIEFTADKFPVGAFIDSQVRIFNSHKVPVQKGDMIYMFSDGYADQFGGPLGKKFKYKPLQKILLDIYKKPANEQRTILNKAFESWIGNLEQIDDVLIIGIRI